VEAAAAAGADSAVGTNVTESTGNQSAASARGGGDSLQDVKKEELHWGFSERSQLKLGTAGVACGLRGPGKRAVELIVGLRQRRTLGASAVGLGLASMVEKAYACEEVEACCPRARAALARATGALAAAHAVDLVPLAEILECVAPSQRDEFVEWCLEALRARWGEGGLIVDGRIFTERGIIRMDALDDQVGAAQEAAFQTPPDGHVWVSGDGREDLSVSNIGDTVGPLPPGVWARKLDQRCLEVREELKPRHIPTRDEQESHPDSWTSTSGEYVSGDEESDWADSEGEEEEDEGHEEDMGLPVVKSEET